MSVKKEENLADRVDKVIEWLEEKGDAASIRLLGRAVDWDRINRKREARKQAEKKKEQTQR